MASALPFTIVKPCGLVDAGLAQTQLVTGHDDDLDVSPPSVARADVARVVVAALQHPDVAAGTRFDLCSRSGPATTDEALVDTLRSARQRWRPEI
mmetsp:Transcript_122706/g.342321  ORF Transcript_122706/g.342321 Transcript_122706/m.342321 type:complete len:95 (+) Transcript_122706:89-373(+)